MDKKVKKEVDKVRLIPISQFYLTK